MYISNLRVSLYKYIESKNMYLCNEYVKLNTHINYNIFFIYNIYEFLKRIYKFAYLIFGIFIYSIYNKYTNTYIYLRIYIIIIMMLFHLI